MRTTILSAYFATLGVLTLYGLHRTYLLWLYVRHLGDAPRPASRFAKLPALTVQIPLYNEMYVARRVIEAAAAIEWPGGRLEIQVLDDSTDETREIVDRTAAGLRARGASVTVVRRPSREGFKAGALAEGLRRTEGELVAVFDADFVPGPEFAVRLVDHFTDPSVGMVQARWGHLNREASRLTRAQAMLLDGHFVIEHAARNRSGRFFNFNGTAGIWRRACIEDAGGWQHDTLTEDLDLSYRAQLAGWRFVYVQDVVALAELPVEMGAFKTQQQRWAQGSIQTARKIVPRILAAPLPLFVKAESIAHLTANAGYVLTVLLALLIGPAVWLRRSIGLAQIMAVDLPLLLVSIVSIGAFYLVSQQAARGSWRDAVRLVPLLMAVGIGISVNNARAVLAGLARRSPEFRRTPKTALAGASGADLATRRYRSPLSAGTWVELGLGVYFAVCVVVAARARLWGALPFLSLFAAGFLYTAGVTLRQERSQPA